MNLIFQQRPQVLPPGGQASAGGGGAGGRPAGPRDALPGVGAVFRADRPRAGARAGHQEGLHHVPRDHGVHQVHTQYAGQAQGLTAEHAQQTGHTQVPALAYFFLMRSNFGHTPLSNFPLLLILSGSHPMII